MGDGIQMQPGRAFPRRRPASPPWGLWALAGTLQAGSVCAETLISIPTVPFRYFVISIKAQELSYSGSSSVYSSFIEI